MTRTVKILLVVFFNVALTLILLEIGVRIWGYSERYISDPIYMPFPGSEEIPFIHKPNLEGARARGMAIINTDSLGLRSRAVGAAYGAKRKDEFRIAIVGDSFTFGEGVPRTEDIFAQQLEDILNQKQNDLRVKVFNFAASGYSVKEMAATLKYRMPQVEPDLVLMAIIPDDFNVSRTPSVDAWGYSANRNLSGFVSKNSRIKRLLRKVRLVYVVRDLRYQLLSARRGPAQPSAAAAIPESYKYVKEFKEIAAQRRLPYAIVLLPVVREGFSDPMKDRLRQDKMAVFDLSWLVREFSPEQFIASRFDAHPSARVHRRMAEELADFVLQERLKTVALPGGSRVHGSPSSR